MTMEQATAVITIVSSVIGALLVWTTTVVALTMWLSKKFRSVESLIYRKVNEIEQGLPFRQLLEEGIL